MFVHLATGARSDAFPAAALAPRTPPKASNWDDEAAMVAAAGGGIAGLVKAKKEQEMRQEEV
jgi:hypothetical protein